MQVWCKLSSSQKCFKYNLLSIVIEQTQNKTWHLQLHTCLLTTLLVDENNIIEIESLPNFKGLPFDAWGKLVTGSFVSSSLFWYLFLNPRTVDSGTACPRSFEYLRTAAIFPFSAAYLPISALIWSLYVWGVPWALCCFRNSFSLMRSIWNKIEPT